MEPYSHRYVAVLGEARQKDDDILRLRAMTAYNRIGVDIFSRCTGERAAQIVQTGRNWLQSDAPTCRQIASNPGVCDVSPF